MFHVKHSASFLANGTIFKNKSRLPKKGSGFLFFSKADSCDTVSHSVSLPTLENFSTKTIIA